jgi:hypothetical protein
VSFLELGLIVETKIKLNSRRDTLGRGCEPSRSRFQPDTPRSGNYFDFNLTDVTAQMTETHQTRSIFVRYLPIG